MKGFLHLRVRIHRWVVSWMIIGVVCGVVAITNILEHNLTRAQEGILIAVGILNWMLGGLVCYALEGVRIEESHPPAPKPSGRRPALRGSNRSLR